MFLGRARPRGSYLGSGQVVAGRGKYLRARRTTGERLPALAAARIAAERVRLERLGIIDANGDLVSRELPPDMLPDSDTTLQTG